MDNATGPCVGRFELPDLCRAPAAVLVVVASQFVVLLLGVASVFSEPWSWRDGLASTLLAQAIGCASLVALCRSRHWINRSHQSLGLFIVWMLPVACAFIVAVAVWWSDPGVFLGLDSEWRSRGVTSFVFGVIGLTALVSLAALRYFQLTAEYEGGLRAEARARYDALQARIRPHFLFNALNSVAALVKLNPSKAESAIEDLADVLRAVIRSPDQAWSLGEELELCRRYLAIEALRLGEQRLRVSWRVEADVPHDLQLPALVLQPLVENAVLHGVARLAEGGAIDVDIRVDGDVLQIQVRNACPHEDDPVSGSGQAIQSVADRLRYRFGPGALLEHGRHGGEYRVVLHLPLGNA